jgi:hypothetical protein
VPDDARRHPVWLALADLYLDTELGDEWLRQIAHVVAASGYSWAEIRRINYDEVAPALLRNLYGMAGEWAGWDADWLRQHLATRYTGPRHRLWGSARLWEWWVDRYTKAPLAQVRELKESGLPQRPLLSSS